MASHQKKKPEGIALLSIYGDEDDEMEDMEEDEERPQQREEGEEERRQQQEVSIVESVFEHTSTLVIVEDNGKIMGSDMLGNENTRSFMQQERQQQQQVLNNNFTPNRAVNFWGSASATTTPRDSLTSPQQQPLEQQRQRERLAIVDYGHDEVAMSPEAEEGEIMAGGGVMYVEELATIDGDYQERSVRVLAPSNQATPAQQYEQNDQAESDAVNYAVNESESTEPEEAVMVPAEEPKDIDPLDVFLPPPAQAKCSVELQEKIIKFLALKKSTRRSFNSEVRNRKEYRNPDFLLHAVTYQDIDQIGSCFSKDVFDPHGYDKSDFYDEIEADMRREMERKEHERKKSQKVDFIPGGTQPGIVVPTPKVNMAIPGIPTVSCSGLNTIPVAVDSIPRDGRHNKKSKWDKVDGGGQDSVSAVAAHTALLSAANAGTGYSAFAQQRRREAEDRRSSDRKLERRS